MLFDEAQFADIEFRSTKSTNYTCISITIHDNVKFTIAFDNSGCIISIYIGSPEGSNWMLCASALDIFLNEFDESNQIQILTVLRDVYMSEYEKAEVDYIIGRVFIADDDVVEHSVFIDFMELIVDEISAQRSGVVTKSARG